MEKSIAEETFLIYLKTPSLFATEDESRPRRSHTATFLSERQGKSERRQRTQGQRPPLPVLFQ